jgi:simple sugar transport system ATP-binding protein
MMIGREIPKVSADTRHRIGEERLVLDRLSLPARTRFGTALKEVSLSVRSGQIVGIAGISGNGQAELAAAISGEVTVSEAEAVMLMGKPAGRLSAGGRRSLGLAFIPEERLGRGAVPQMSLADNTLLTAYGTGLVRRGFIRRAAERALTGRVISEFDVRTTGPDVEAANLSGGNLQKFMLGREIMQSPKVLFVSQPTWGVDIGAATAIRRRLIDMRNQGTAILVISEELEELFEICDILHVLHAGRMSGPRDPHVTTAAQIGALMTGTGDGAPA